MRFSIFLRRAVASSVCLLPLLSLAVPAPAGAVADSAANVLARAPLAFEPNLGQSDPEVRYMARGAGYAVFLTREEAVLALISETSGAPIRKGGPAPSLERSVLRVRTLGSQPAESLEPEQALPGRSRYVRLSDPERSVPDAPRHGRVRARNVYPGIDLIYYGNGERLQYDFEVAPGADPGEIRLGFEGARGLALDEAGNLRLRMSNGELVQQAPVLYQDTAAGRRPVSGSFRLAGDTVAFAVGAYDPRLPLVIDPTLAWASLLGGSSTEWTFDVAVTPNGQAYACGYTNSTNFPTRPAAADPDLVDADAYVTKFNLDGSGIDWSIYVGGPGYQSANAIAIDANRETSITGSTEELDPAGDAWVFHLDAAGNLEWSRILRGTQFERGEEIHIDSALNTYVVGTTYSADFRGPNAPQSVAQPAFGGESDAFVAKLNRFGTVVYTTFYGGPDAEEGRAIALDLSGRIVFAGTKTVYSPVLAVDSFAVRLSLDGSVFQGRLQFGGSGEDHAAGIAVDPSGNVWVAGTTYSANFPTTGTAIRRTLAGESDAFLARLFGNWSGFSYSTYLGNAQKQVVVGLLVDDVGRLYPVGQVTQVNQPDPAAQMYDVWAARYVPSNNTASAITFPAAGNDFTGGCAMDGSRWIYIAGVTTSADIATAGAFQTQLKGSFDGFVAKIGF